MSSNAKRRGQQTRFRVGDEPNNSMKVSFTMYRVQNHKTRKKSYRIPENAVVVSWGALLTRRTAAEVAVGVLFDVTRTLLHSSEFAGRDAPGIVILLLFGVCFKRFRT